KQVEMDIDRKTKQSEVRDYEEVDQVSEVQNEKKLDLLVERKKEVFQEQTRQTEVLYYDTKLKWLLENEEDNNKQDRSFQKEKEIHEVCNEKQEEVCRKQKQQINEQDIQEVRKKYKVLKEESEKTEEDLASTKSIKAIILSLMSDIKTKLYEEIKKANRQKEGSKRENSEDSNIEK
ncbi:45679_t:CDS:2, partial [Gigaspora margarita]